MICEVFVGDPHVCQVQEQGQEDHAEEEEFGYEFCVRANLESNNTYNRRIST